MIVSAVRRSAEPPKYHMRRHYWLMKGEPLICPNGHKLKHNAAILDHEALICQHQEPHQKGECGSRIYVLSMPRGIRFVAEVTVVEMLYMRDNCMAVDDVIAYLRGRSA